MSWLIEPWTYPFMRWGLLCCLILASVHAYLGYHVVRRGVLFVDLSMAQMAALGAAFAVVAGFEHGTPGEYALSLSFALATATVIAALRSTRIHQEAIIAIIYGLATAATFVVLEHSPHGMEEVKHLLVGQILTVAPLEVLITGLVYALLGLVLSRLHPHVLAVTAEEPVARRTAIDLAFYAVFAVVVTSAVALVGVLLVFSFLVLPAVAAIYLTEGSTARLAWGTGLAAVGSLIGLHAAYFLDLPAGPAIVLALGVLLGATALRAMVLHR